jgi:AcrR family transcriptional regulator
MLASVTYRRVPRGVREVQMLDAAVAEFSRRGFHDASMDDIANRANVSKPMVYAYLGAKEDLFIACVHREGTRLMEAIVDVVDPDLAPDQQLWRGMRAFFGFVAANRDGWAVIHRHARGPFAAERAVMRAAMIDVVTGMLRRAVLREPPDADLYAVAHVLVGAGESLADWLVDHPDESPDGTAGRLMNIVWLGAGQLLDGASWRPAGADRRPDSSEATGPSHEIHSLVRDADIGDPVSGSLRGM